MKTSKFLGHDITKLIVGDNMFTGHSYVEHVIGRDELLDYYDTKHLYETFWKIEEAGYNCMLPLGSEVNIQMIYEYKRDGGKMNFIIQPTNNYKNLTPYMNNLARIEPIGIYHQGTTTDFLYEKNQIQQIVDTMKEYRVLGIPVGLCSHVPERIERCEREGWGADFYMTCLYNCRRGREGEPSGFLTGKVKKNIPFYPEDKPVALDLINRLDKPCIAYKIFAGGWAISGDEPAFGETPDAIKQKIKGVYREVFSNIKENDIACIGVNNMQNEQIKTDAVLFDEVMQEMENENK